MGRNVYETIQKRFQGHDWERIGNYICSSHSKFAEKFINWESLDMDGCGIIFIDLHTIISAAWEHRHDADSLEDIRSMSEWIRKYLRGKRKPRSYYEKKYVKFHIF